MMMACSEEITPTPYTYTKNFTGENSKTWRVNFLEETLNGKVTSTFTLQCASDDRYIFFANTERSFRVTTGNRKCYEDPEPAVINDTWTFNNGNATLTMILPFFTPDFSLPFIVREVRRNKMELEIFFGDNNSGSYRIHFDAVDED